MIVNMNLSPYMCSTDRLPLVRAYAEMVDIALTAGRINPPLSPVCPECGCNFGDLDEAHEDTEHVIIATTSDTLAVVVACEGYFTIDPNLVGIESRNWQGPDDLTNVTSVPDVTPEDFA